MQSASMLGVLELLREPVQPLVEALAIRRARGLHSFVLANVETDKVDKQRSNTHEETKKREQLIFVVYLDVPVAAAERVQAELVGDLGSIHGIWQILKWVCESPRKRAEKHKPVSLIPTRISTRPSPST